MVNLEIAPCSTIFLVPNAASVGTPWFSRSQRGLRRGSVVEVTVSDPGGKSEALPAAWQSFALNS